MSSTSENAPQVSLGIGSIISESFSIFFRKFFIIMLLGAGPSIVGYALKGILFGWNSAIAESDQLVALGGLAFAFSTLVDIVVYGLMTAMLVLLAYDVKLDRQRSIGEYIRTGLRPIIPITILGFVVSILVGIGAIFLIIPGLWLYAVFSVTIPSIVIEKAGFGGMGRSAALTKGYRWPIVGLLVVMGVIAIVLSILIGVIISIPASIGIGVFGGIIAAAFLTGLGYGMMNICLALIYARLREIKEGVHVDQLASVFD